MLIRNIHYFKAFQKLLLQIQILQIRYRFIENGMSENEREINDVTKQNTK